MDSYWNWEETEKDISSSFNFSDFWASFDFSPPESFNGTPHINIPIAGIEFVLNHTNMLQGLNQMKQLDVISFPWDMDVPTIIGNEIEIDESLLKLKIGRSMGIINATIENPDIMPDVEALWIRPRDVKVPEISKGRFYRGLLGPILGSSCSPFAASLNRKISFSSRVVTLMREFSKEIDPTAEDQYAYLEMDILLKKLFAHNFLRLLQGIADIQATDRRLLNKPIVQLGLFKNMTGWQQKDWIPIEIWKEQGWQIYHIFLSEKMTNELIEQMRLGGKWQIDYTFPNYRTGVPGCGSDLCRWYWKIILNYPKYHPPWLLATVWHLALLQQLQHRSNKPPGSVQQKY